MLLNTDVLKADSGDMSFALHVYESAFSKAKVKHMLGIHLR